MSATVGSKVRQAELPPTVWAAENTDQLNLTNTVFANGSPEVSVTFTAPASGRVLIINGGGLRNNTGDDQAYIDSEVRANNGSGSLIRGASVTSDGVLSCTGESVAMEYKCRAYVLSGLTAGGTYFARVQHRAATGGGTADIGGRSIIVQPIP